MRVLALLLLTACQAPALGDPSWQTASFCVDAGLQADATAAMARWHAAAFRVQMRVASDACDGEIRFGVTPGGYDASAIAGFIKVDPASEYASERVTLLTHELGHHVIGSGYGGQDPYHNQDNQSVMFLRSASDAITDVDVALIP